MKLYLIQHGLSVSEDVDPQKPLSEEGKAQTEKAARLLKAERVNVENLWFSKKMRAVQTAQIISQYVTPSNARERDDLKPNDPVDKFPGEIKNLAGDLMIVGHLPFLKKLTVLLLCGKDEGDIISFKNSGIICLGHMDKWRIEWYLTPDLL
ncbi:MAG: phosphohistidine phosphatase SixA [Candidatus Omnitrophota bacterium]|nr:phosphohistidine phosphatase SixA [Candidatus Omnitrophota bacterium]MBU1895195.1 phosphohistidine phosphatase SixA [Candidatus Omnitrophota bacterium]